jgi:predicted P-loop ATPase
MTALRDAPEWETVLAHDEFAMNTIAIGPPPWALDPSNWCSRPWTDNDDVLTAEWLHHHKIGVSVIVTHQAVEAVARERMVHPPLDYLESLEWDGRVRLDHWLRDYLGAPDSTYTKSIGRHSLIAAVARLRQPGCKVDTVPIIEGPQGIFKSSALRLLFDPWFSDELADLGSKDAAMQMRGAWLIEISELDAMSRTEVSRIKAFISRSTDRFRPPYGHHVIESPRECVFWGTTNSDAYLKDETGGRRFWPIKAGKIDLDGLGAARDQLWAEASALHRGGAAWWIVNPEAARIAEGEQRARYVGDPWDDPIASYLATCTAAVSIEDLLTGAIGMERSRWSQAESNRVARCLIAHGWVRFQVRTGDKRTWKYRRGS